MISSAWAIGWLFFGLACMEIGTPGQTVVSAGLEWSISKLKEQFYPGEPVVLVIQVKNNRSEQESIFIDEQTDVSCEVLDTAGRVVVKSKKRVPKEGMGWPFGVLLHDIPPGETGKKAIILNKWCSTLLPAGKYEVNYDIKYKLSSEARRGDDPNMLYLGQAHTIRLGQGIELLDPNPVKEWEILGRIVADLKKDHKKGRSSQDRRKWDEVIEQERLSREMVIYTEWPTAVPYQLQLITMACDSWQIGEAISALVRSKTLEAAIGLMRCLEDPLFKEHPMYKAAREEVIEAIYRLRDSNIPEIIGATERFVHTYPRPKVVDLLMD